MQRIILLVLDSVGVGALPDAGRYGDAGADTLGHIFQAMGPSYALPNLARMGLCRLPAGNRSCMQENSTAAYGRMQCASPAKDTTAGHWELAGLVLEKPFPTYPHGFPQELIADFEKRIGTKILGNVPASGTEIIRQLGDEHCRTGYPIIYTSADSVFQIAAHETFFGLERLYHVCRIAREMLTGEHAVGRVIARPFTGDTGAYIRTANRRDYSLTPFAPTILDRVKESGGEVVAVGKIEDIFNRQGITRAVHSRSNTEGMQVTLDAVRVSPAARTLIFTNLVDFDMLWGHRRDVRSYADGLKAFDEFLPTLLAALQPDDLLIITADHGCDPTYTQHTDHTREYVPLLVQGRRVWRGKDLGTRATFADVAQTVADIFGLAPMEHGTSFRKELGL